MYHSPHRPAGDILEMAVRDQVTSSPERVVVKTERAPTPAAEAEVEVELEEQTEAGTMDGAMVTASRGRRSQLRFKVVGEDEVEAERERQRQPGATRVHLVRYARVGDKTIKLWECGYCSKEFRHQYTLTRHLPTHTGERNFRCEACGKAFRQLSTLSQHRAIHTDARPYVCELCEKTFNRVSTLISHRKTHSDHKPHRCPTCGKGFHQKGNLRNHVFTHTNERPYKCELCGKGFNQMSNLVCHRAHSHGDRARYTCFICNLEFSRKGALRAHEEFRHGVRYRSPPPSRRSQPSAMRPPAPTAAATPSVSGGVLIDPIRTRAMRAAEREGQTPFALLKPARGIPVLVKVHPGPGSRQMLVPATADDLRQAGKITVSRQPPSNAKLKAVQIKVPVVATVVQVVAPDGSLQIKIEPPAPEYDLATDGGRNEDEEDLDVMGETVSVQEVQSETVDEESHVEVMETQEESAAISSAPESQIDLLNMARNGDIQFVRDTGDGTYQVLSEQEAAEIISQPGNASIQVVEEGPDIKPVVDNSTAIVTEANPEGSSLWSLVEAIRSAGFCVQEDGTRIVITGGENEEPQVVQQEVVYEDGGSSSPPYVLLEEAEVTAEVVPSDS